MCTTCLFAILTLGFIAAGSLGCDHPIGTPAGAQEVAPQPAQATVVGWGTLSGRIRFQGEIPTRPRIDTTKDRLCTMPLLDESFVVDPASRGLANVLIYAIRAPQVHPDFAGEPAKEVTLTMNHCRSEPRMVVSTLKDRFVALNGDRTTHNVKGDPPGGARSFNMLLVPQDTFPIKFPKATSYPYDITCAIHPWMKAWHLVRPDPYFAVTKPDGAFKIERLPTGVKLEFQVWHELGAGTFGGLRAKPEWSQEGRFEITIPKDGETMTLELDVEAKHFL